ncbi:MAG: hypothetical protein PHX34_05815 [Candidatus Shapirobacteria bacterium]|nr:hypothetical protein [Candidatus Shapirobacteria bacterium]
MDSATLFYCIVTIIIYGVMGGYFLYDFYKDFTCSKIIFLRKDKSFLRFIKSVRINPSLKEYVTKNNTSFTIPDEISYANKYGKPVYLMDDESKKRILFKDDTNIDNKYLLETLDAITQTKFIKGTVNSMISKAKADWSLTIIYLVCGFLGGTLFGIFLPMFAPKMFGGG